MIEDFDACYRAVSSRDPRFDGMFFTAVTSTHIYCRPSCPAITPKASNVRFFRTAAAAQAAGFRACKRCRPDASPGSPEWDSRADVVGRAMRAIGDGVVDRDGVRGLAGRLGYSERHLGRLLLSEVGAGPQELARAHRAQTARVLIEMTPLPFAEIAFASGFASIRQFNETVRAVFASTPTELRRRAGTEQPAPAGSISLRLPYRAPFDAPGLFGFLGARAVPGIEEYDGVVYRRTLSLPYSTGIAELEAAGSHVRCVLRLDDVRDVTAAVHRCRRMLDLDADPVAVDRVLATDPRLRPAVKKHPGRRLPGTVDGQELAVRAVLGQQVSVAGARTLAGRLVATFGKPLTRSDGSLTHLFPDADALAEADLSKIGLPAARQATIKHLASALARGDIDLDPSADRERATSELLEVPGIGPWTVSYIRMRALGDPDAFPPGDLGVRKALKQLGLLDEAVASERWRPWRAYAVQHLWGMG